MYRLLMFIEVSGKKSEAMKFYAQGQNSFTLRWSVQGCWRKMIVWRKLSTFGKQTDKHFCIRVCGV